MRFGLRLYIPLSICAMVTACGSTKNTGAKLAAGPWQETPIVIDGQNMDWPNPYPSYDDKSRLGYAISNDKENLYLTVETGDDITAMKLLRAGMTVSIDPTGGKEQKLSIKYPMPNPDENSGQWQQHIPTNTELPNRAGRAERFLKAIKNARDMSIEGFAPDCNGGYMVAQQNKCGIVVHMDMDEYQTLIWEAKIPFKAFYKDRLTAADKGKPISICFAVHAVPKPESEKTHGNNNGTGMNMGNGMGSGMHNGGGRGGGGGMNGNSSRNFANREQLHETTKTWIHTGLAYKE